MSKKIKKRKKTLFIAGIIVALVVLAIVVSSIFASEISDKLKGALANLNPFAQEEAGESGEGEGTEEPTTTIVNKSKDETIIASGSGGGAAEVTYGNGALEIKNWVSDSDFDKGLHYTINRQGGTDNYDSYDRRYCNSSCLFSPSGKATKIISRITGYELLNDVRPVNSLSTIYLELSLHSQSGGAITLNSTNELRLSMPLAGSPYFYDFANKTLTIQQYDPSNANAVYTLYNVREVINNNNGIIILPNLNGTYASQVPYAYFRIMFS